MVCMKSNYLISVVISILFISCSSTYTLSDFTSKDKFYEDFNKSAGGKILRITTVNDSSFTANQGANVSNDSLTFFTIVRKEVKLSKTDIKDIKYYGTDMSDLSATILLNNGDTATAKKINLGTDSSISAVLFFSKNGILPVLKLKEVSYINHPMGIFMGFLIGIPAGLFTDIIIRPAFFEDSKGNPVSNTSDKILNSVSILYPVIGGIIMGEKGFIYTYKFNP